MNASISGEALDWAVPVLFAQDPSDRLVARRAENVASLSPVRAAATRDRPAPDRPAPGRLGRCGASSRTSSGSLGS
ncbi:MAG: hypothetical protein U0599_13395 [Vicinamibacteria bacterium]